jgi:hypothetical protein
MDQSSAANRDRAICGRKHPHEDWKQFLEANGLGRNFGRTRGWSLCVRHHSASGAVWPLTPGDARTFCGSRRRATAPGFLGVGANRDRQTAHTDHHLKRVASDAEHWRNWLERLVVQASLIALIGTGAFALATHVLARFCDNVCAACDRRATVATKLPNAVSLTFAAQRALVQSD